MSHDRARPGDEPDPPDRTDGTDAECRRLADAIGRRWHAAGIGGAFLARHLGSRDWLGFGVHRALPIASVVKVPIALAALHLFETGELDPMAPQRFAPPDEPAGTAGLAVFSGPATVATADLVYLMLALSDNLAADRLLELVGPDRLRRLLADWDLVDIRVRHPLVELYRAAARSATGDFGLALELAIGGGLGDGAHRLPTLDVRTATVASAAGLARLLEVVWSEQVASPAACARLRELMGLQLAIHRLSVELRSDTVRVSGKTGGYLNLRHEIGVVETRRGDVVALVALTRSAVPAFVQPAVDDAIGAAARDAVDLLRQRA